VALGFPDRVLFGIRQIASRSTLWFADHALILGRIIAGAQDGSGSVLFLIFGPEGPNFRDPDATVRTQMAKDPSQGD
jgi:hypothetical protein